MCTISACMLMLDLSWKYHVMLDICHHPSVCVSVSLFPPAYLFCFKSFSEGYCYTVYWVGLICQSQPDILSTHRAGVQVEVDLGIDTIVWWRSHRRKARKTSRNRKIKYWAVQIISQIVFFFFFHDSVCMCVSVDCECWGLRLLASEFIISRWDLDFPSVPCGSCVIKLTPNLIFHFVSFSLPGCTSLSLVVCLFLYRSLNFF